VILQPTREPGERQRGSCAVPQYHDERAIDGIAISTVAQGGLVSSTTSTANAGTISRPPMRRNSGTPDAPADIERK
jgi:hypothetical protein